MSCSNSIDKDFSKLISDVDSLSSQILETYCYSESVDHLDEIRQKLVIARDRFIKETGQGTHD